VAIRGPTDVSLDKHPNNELTDVRRPIEWTAVPYFLWANREPGWMSVWLPLDA
jgi:DUF1680 family protein